MTEERDQKPAPDSSEPSRLEAGDFVYLNLDWVEPPNRGSPFNNQIGLLLGSGQYPAIEQALINKPLNTQNSFLVVDEGTTKQVVPAPTLEKLFDQQTANLLNQLGFSSPIKFLTADLSSVKSLPVDQDRLIEMRESLSESLKDRDLVTISVKNVYRWSKMSESSSVSTMADLHGSTVSAWPLFGGSPSRTGYHPSATGPQQVIERWRFETGDRVQSSPAVVDGTVYVGSNHIWALDATDGTQQWCFNTSTTVGGSPTVASGTVFIGAGNRGIYALDATDGTKQWQFKTGGPIGTSPAVVDGTVYVGGGESVYAIDAVPC